MTLLQRLAARVTQPLQRLVCGNSESAAKINLNADAPRTQKLPSQPRGVAVARDGSVTAVACMRHVYVTRAGAPPIVHQVAAESTAIAIHPDARTIAVGAMASDGVHLCSKLLHASG